MFWGLSNVLDKFKGSRAPMMEGLVVMALNVSQHLKLLFGLGIVSLKQEI